MELIGIISAVIGLLVWVGQMEDSGSFVNSFDGVLGWIIVILWFCIGLPVCTIIPYFILSSIG